MEALGEGRAIVDGREKGYRFLHIGPGAAAELAHLRLQHFGGAGPGADDRAAAAVLNEGALRAYGVAVHTTTKARGRGGALFNAARARALLQRLEVSSPDGHVAAEQGIEAEVTGAVLLSPCPDPSVVGGGGARVARCFDAARDALGTTAGRAAVAAALGVARDEGFEALIVVDSPEDGPVAGATSGGSACRAMEVGEVDEQGVAAAGATPDAAAVAAFLAAAAAGSSSGGCSLRAAVAEAGRSGAPTLVFLAPAAVHAVTEGPMRVPADAFVKITGGLQPRGGLPVVDGAGNGGRRLFEVERDAYLEVRFWSLYVWVGLIRPPSIDQ